MNNIFNTIQNSYGYTNYEMALIKYVLFSIASEFSKLIILSLLFIYIDKWEYFIVSFILLILLRLNSGGYHSKHYITCLILTLSISYASIVFLPNVCIPNFSIIITSLIMCLIINYIIGPIASPFRPSPNSILIKNCKNNSFIIIFFFIVLVSIFNRTQSAQPYLIVGYWTIILHTVQMIFAKVLKKGGFFK